MYARLNQPQPAMSQPSPQWVITYIEPGEHIIAHGRTHNKASKYATISTANPD